MLVVPNIKWESPHQKFIYPAGLFSIAACLENDYETLLVDANIDNLSKEALGKIIEDFAPDIVAVSCMTTEYRNNAYSVCRLAKNISRSTVGPVNQAG